jgi:cyanate permease
LQAATYYNPLKIFLLLSVFVCLLGVLFASVSLAFNSMPLFCLGMSGIFVASLIFCLGLLAELLKQIMAGGME